MTVKEKIIRKSIASVEKQLNEIKRILTLNIVGGIVDLQIEAISEAKKMEARKAAPYLKEAIKKEEGLRKLFEKQKKLMLLDKPYSLERELVDLKNELFFLERRKI